MSQQKKGAYVEVSIALTQTQWDWLESMASKHKLSSCSKAMRCCINCVALGDAKDAGSSSKNGVDCVTKSVELSKEQVFWMETKQSNDATGVVRSCMEMDEYTVFGIIRCKKSIAECDGAQDAVRNIGEHYCKKNGEVEVKENIDITEGCGCEQK
mmetsp:Transcript_44284/g.93046  ORF Transcript_44284/g.93046 Transcript_44284/m.93046 type:complete len:155 (-) Transcript_44284:553-1017(-)